MLGYPMQMPRDEVEDLLIPKPRGRLAVDFQRGRLKEEDVAAVFQGSDIGIKRFPVVAHQRYPAGGGELRGHTPTLQDRRRRVPIQGLPRFGLTQGLQEANAAAIGIQAIDIIEYEWLMAMFVSLHVNAQGRGLAADPADVAVQRLANAATLADAGRAEEHQQVQMAGGKGADVLFQLDVAQHADGVRRQTAR